MKNKMALFNFGLLCFVASLAFAHPLYAEECWIDSGLPFFDNKKDIDMFARMAVQDDRRGSMDLARQKGHFRERRSVVNSVRKNYPICTFKSDDKTFYVLCDFIYCY